MNHLQDVIDFHNKFGINPTYFADHTMPVDLREFRIKFMQEELDEYKEAVENGDMEKAMDALIDLEYVLLGTAYMHQFKHNEGWDRVHSANMKKVRARRDGSDSVRGSAWDVVKPEGWVAPDLSDLL